MALSTEQRTDIIEKLSAATVLEIAELVGIVHQAFGGEHRILLRDAVDRAAEHGARRLRPGEPTDVEQRRNAVARLDPGDAVPDRLDGAGRAGQRHDLGLLAQAGEQVLGHDEIAVVQRSRVQPHQGFTRARLRDRHVPDRQRFDTLAGLQHHLFHFTLPRIRLA